MKATRLLSQQHREVESLFERLEKSKGDAPKLLQELANNLAAHMVIEQELFYPAARQADEDLVLESYEEHAVARFALRRLLSVDHQNKSFKARLTTLKELIQHHVKEEESDLFPHVEEALGDEKLEQLGAKMKALFNETKAVGYESALAKTTRNKSGERRKSLGVVAARRGDGQARNTAHR